MWNTSPVIFILKYLDGGNNGNREGLYIFWALKSLQMVTAAMKLKDA